MNRKELQNILESNPLKCKVFYMDRPEENPDNVIVYFRVPNNAFKADNKIYINRTTVQVSHFHKKKLDNIEQFLNSTLNAELVFQSKERGSNYVNLSSDYWHTAYQFEVYIDEEGW